MFEFIINYLEKSVERLEEDVDDFFDGSAFNPLKSLEKTLKRTEEDVEDFFE